MVLSMSWMISPWMSTDQAVAPGGRTSQSLDSPAAREKRSTEPVLLIMVNPAVVGWWF